MTNLLETEHAGVAITFNEQTERWVAKIDGHAVAADSLKKLKEKIDRITKPKNHQRRPAIQLEGGRYSECDSFVTITSFDQEEGRYGHRFAWITDENKSRSKVSFGNLRVDSPENRLMVERRTELRKQIRALEREFEALAEKMARVIDDETAVAQMGAL